MFKYNLCKVTCLVGGRSGPRTNAHFSVCSTLPVCLSLPGIHCPLFLYLTLSSKGVCYQTIFSEHCFQPCHCGFITHHFHQSSGSKPSPSSVPELFADLHYLSRYPVNNPEAGELGAWITSPCLTAFSLISSCFFGWIDNIEFPL